MIRRSTLLLLALTAACTETRLVPPDPVAGLDAGTDSLVLSPGESLTVTVVPRDEAGNPLYDRQIDFNSSAPATATIDSAGKVLAMTVGVSQLRFSSEGVADSVHLRVVTSWVGGALGDEYGPSCLLRPDRRAWCWGYGQGSSGIPKAKASPLAFGDLDAGYYHICGVAADSTGWCWGYDEDGEILGAEYDVPEPVQQLPGTKFLSLTAGWHHTCGVATDATGYCWGRNDQGQLGDSVPYGQSAFAVEVLGGHAWRQIGAGDFWSCGLDTSGTAWCWGYLFHQSPLTESPVPVAVPGVPTLDTLVVGGDFACGLTVEKTAWCWGLDADGQLGHSSGPGAAAVATSTLFESLAVGYNEVCGLDAEGAAWCWGHGGFTGDGTWEDRASPGKVLGDHRFVALTGGWSGFCGLTSGGAAYCWGALRIWNEQALAPRRVWDP